MIKIPRIRFSICSKRLNISLIAQLILLSLSLCRLIAEVTLSPSIDVVRDNRSRILATQFLRNNVRKFSQRCESCQTSGEIDKALQRTYGRSGVGNELVDNIWARAIYMCACRLISIFYDNAQIQFASRYQPTRTAWPDPNLISLSPPPLSPCA